MRVISIHQANKVQQGMLDIFLSDIRSGFSHVYSTGFGMNHSTYYGGNRYNTGNDSHNDQSPFMPGMPSSSGLDRSQAFASVPITEDEEQRTRCGMFFEDEFSSGTESDDGDADSEASQIYKKFESDPSLLGNALFGDYMLAKQRWRRFSGRLPRRYRRGHYNRFRQRSNFNKEQRHGKTYSSFLPPNAFAAHRGPGGKGKGKGGGSKQNPRCKDGKIMTCHKSGSTEHLLRRCPKNDSSGPASGSLAMILSGTSLQFYAGTLGGEFGRIPSNSNSTESFKRAGSVMDDLESWRSIASSRRRVDDAQQPQQGVSSTDIASPPDYSGNPNPRFPPPDMPPPSLHEIQTKTVQTTTATAAWTSFTTGVPSVFPAGSSVLNNVVSQDPNAWMSFGYGSRGFGSTTQPKAQIVGESASAADPRPSEHGAESPVSSTPKRRKAADQQVRQATTLQLTSLLQGMSGGPSQETTDSFPWWEKACDLDANEPVPARPFLPARTFHTMTCLDDGTIGLLVDPGAHDNLGGSNTFRHLGNQIGTRVINRRLDLPLNVSGVGKESQQAREAMTVEFQLMGQNDEVIQASYCAPVIENSNLPPLLGLKSLTAKRALLDMHSRFVDLSRSRWC